MSDMTITNNIEKHIHSYAPRLTEMASHWVTDSARPMASNSATLKKQEFSISIM